MSLDQMSIDLYIVEYLHRYVVPSLVLRTSHAECGVRSHQADFRTEWPAGRRLL